MEPLASGRARFRGRRLRRHVGALGEAGVALAVPLFAALSSQSVRVALAGHCELAAELVKTLFDALQLAASIVDLFGQLGE